MSWPRAPPCSGDSAWDCTGGLASGLPGFLHHSSEAGTVLVPVGHHAPSSPGRAQRLGAESGPGHTVSAQPARYCPVHSVPPTPPSHLPSALQQSRPAGRSEPTAYRPASALPLFCRPGPQGGHVAGGGQGRRGVDMQSAVPPRLAPRGSRHGATTPGLKMAPPPRGHAQSRGWSTLGSSRNGDGRGIHPGLNSGPDGPVRLHDRGRASPSLRKQEVGV